MGDAELTVLALCLQCDDVSVASQHGVTEDWFSSGNNKKLWSEMTSRKERGKGIDLIWARNHVGDDEFVQRLNSAYAPMANPKSELRSAVEILQDHYLRRKGKEITFAYLVDNVKNDDPNDVIDHAIQQLTALRNVNRPNDEIDVRTEIERRITSGLTIKTGYRTLDTMTRGIEPSLWLIGGFPQVGKTTFVTNITLHVAEQSFTVVMFSGELDKVKLHEKIATMLSGFNPYLEIGEERRSEFMSHVDKVEELPIQVIEDLSLARIIAEIQKREARLYIIDYLQLVDVNKRFESREREVSYIIQELARLKQTYQVCIMAISSLNRRNWDEIPTLANLKDSGSLEYTSDYVLLLEKPIRRLGGKELHQAKMEGKDSIVKGYLAKNRVYGIEGYLSLEFDKQSLRIKEKVE